MGRFFKAQPAQFLDDAMYQHPAQLMAQVIQAKDKQADDFFATTDLMEEFEMDPHKVDDPVARQKAQEIEDMVTGLTEEAMGDVSNLSNYQMKLKKMQRKVDDIKEKHIDPINKKNKLIKEEHKTLIDLYRKNPDQYEQFESVQDIIDFVDSKYADSGGYMAEDGTYNDTPQVGLYGKDSNLDIVKNLIEGHTSYDFKSQYGRDVSIAKAWKGLEAHEIDKMLDSYLNDDAKINQNLQQRVDLAKMRGDITASLDKEKAKLKKQLEIKADEHFGKRKVEERTTYRTSTGPGGKTETPEPDFTSSEVYMEENPYYGVVTSSGLQRKVIERKQNAMNEMNKSLQVKGLEGIVINADLTVSLPGEEDMNIHELQEHVSDTVTDASPIINNIQSQMEAIEVQNLLLESIDQGRVDDDVAKNIGSKEFLGKNEVFGQQANNLIPTKEAKAYSKELETNYKDEKIKSAYINVGKIETTKIGEDYFVFRKKVNGILETPEELKERAERQLGKGQSYVVIEGMYDEIEDGSIKLEKLQEHFKKIEDYRIAIKVVEESNNKNTVISIDASGFIDTAGLTDEQKAVYEQRQATAQAKREKTTETTDIKKPSIIQDGNFDFSDRRMLGKTQVTIGGNSPNNYTIDVYVDLNKAPISERYRQTLNAGKQMFKSVYDLKDQLGGSILIENENGNYDGSTNLGDLEVGDLKIDNGYMYYKGRTVNNEAEATKLMQIYLKQVTSPEQED